MPRRQDFVHQKPTSCNRPAAKFRSMMAHAFASRPADVEIEGPDAGRQLSIGLEHHAAGRVGDAIRASQRGLAVIESKPPGFVATETISELHANFGNACMVRGDIELAAANYKAALQLAPGLTACWCNLGTAYLKSGRPDDAVALYVHPLTLDPRHWPSRTNLAQALIATRQYPLARLLLTELAGERPQDARLHQQLGKLHVELNEPRSALACFQQAALLDPADAETIYWVGGIRQQLGESEAAEAAYVRAAQLQPLIRRPAAKYPADFRALALFAPFAGNLPTGYLFKACPYDTDTLALMASGEYDVELLRQNVQVVVNLISDADQADELLSLAADLVGRLDRPIVNDPRKIERTTRDAVPRLLGGIPGCRIPKGLRQKAGDELEKIGCPVELGAFLAQHADTDRYFIEYVDYRSADGYFRKYRFIFVDGQILPSHLAIADGWKVHHDSTDMAEHPWMQREEEAFLNDPATVFNSGHYRALREIRRRIGLEFFGIDCGLDRAGNLVVFEVNASMLVHEQNEDFPYKAPFVLRIKLAFDEMLRKFSVAGG